MLRYPAANWMIHSSILNITIYLELWQLIKWHSGGAPWCPELWEVSDRIWWWCWCTWLRSTEHSLPCSPGISSVPGHAASQVGASHITLVSTGTVITARVTLLGLMVVTGLDCRLLTAGGGPARPVAVFYPAQQHLQYTPPPSIHQLISLPNLHLNLIPFSSLSLCLPVSVCVSGCVWQ